MGITQAQVVSGLQKELIKNWRILKLKHKHPIYLLRRAGAAAGNGTRRKNGRK